MQKAEIYDVKQDSRFQDYYIDIDETRTRTLPDGSEITYRYLHGGVEAMHFKFSFCFPDKERYAGHFFQYLSPFPGPDEELASLARSGADDQIAFALTHGAYYVETNMCSGAPFGGMPDNTLVWKSSAAAAEISRIKAMEIYGCGRPFGYVYGGSGGGYKSMACIENTNAWDGAVPYVIGSPVSLPNSITVHAQGQRCLRRVFSQVVDAVDAGGSGDPYAGLTEDEAAMLREITAMGFPPRAWFIEAGGEINDGSLPVLTPTVKMMDGGYFTDFWTLPGYAGADPASSAVRDRLQFRGKVKSVHLAGENTEAREIDDRNGVDTAWQKQLADGRDNWIELESVPEGDDLYLSGVTITIESGESAGKQLLLDTIKGNCVLIGMCFGMENVREVLEKVRPGDTVSLDNSDYIAILHYYRHQVPEDLSFHAFDQFRNEDGTPKLPQRKAVIGYQFTGTGTVQSGNIQGKVIILQSLMDESTWPWCADWYRKKVISAKGGEEDFRLYYMDHCLHGDITAIQSGAVTNYVGALHQALLDLSDWVEKGVEPRPTTNYQYEDGQIIVPDDALERRGVQPVVTLSANGAEAVRVKVGEQVHFTVHVQVPADAGAVTQVRYNFDTKREVCGEMPYPAEGAFRRDENGAVSEISHTYTTPGVYYAAAYAAIERSGDADAWYTQIGNLARVRVIVEE